jgi:hypothetical protein
VDFLEISDIEGVSEGISEGLVQGHQRRGLCHEEGQGIDVARLEFLALLVQWNGVDLHKDVGDKRSQDRGH